MNEKAKKIVDWIVKVALIITIILLLIYNCSLQKNLNNIVTPTGNVDIIEITCDKDSTCESKPANGNENNDNNNDDVNDDKFEVYDNIIKWDGVKKAEIFKKTMYAKNDTIAPESNNTYQFVVKNGTEYKLRYSIEFTEDNSHHINIKYKLKKNDDYIIDHYVSYNELNITNILVNSNESDTYYLEWKWISSSNDTSVGKADNATYNLNISIKAESTND